MGLSILPSFAVLEYCFFRCDCPGGVGTLVAVSTSYARPAGGDDGLPDGWLCYVLPTEEDTNRSRWPVHPAWVVVQSVFAEPTELGLGLVVRQRIREKNLERGVAFTIGYVSTLAAWLGGDYATPGADASLTLQWLY